MTISVLHVCAAALCALAPTLPIQSPQDPSCTREELARDADALGLGIWFGYSLARLGDVDVDGVADFAVGSPLASGFEYTPGRVAAISAASGKVLWVEAGEQGFGECVASLGDLDGDGLEDLGVTAWSNRVVLLSGADGRRIRAHDVQADDGRDRSACVAGLEDVDGDGVGDVLIGRPRSGGLWVHSSADGAELLHVAPEAGTWAGAVVLGLGDVNGDGDGAGDFAFTRCGHAPLEHEDFEIARSPTAVAVASGKTGEVLYTFEPARSSTPDELRLAAIGDVDLDGVADFAVAATNARPDGDPRVPGCVELHSGRNGGLLGSAGDEHTNRSFGYALDASVEGELLVSQFAKGDEDLLHGFLFAYELAPLEPSWHQEAPNPFGHSVLCLDDVDGDGRADYAVGVTFDDAGAFEQGYVQVRSGATHRVLYRVPPPG